LEKSAVDSNTPLQIGDTLFTCTPDDRIAAVDADSGAERWKFDTHSSSPFWNRCRGLGYCKLKEAPADGVCAERIVNSTIDARLFDGQPELLHIEEQVASARNDRAVFARAAAGDATRPRSLVQIRRNARLVRASPRGKHDCAIGWV
jgi:hypothetical protein